MQHIHIYLYIYIQTSQLQQLDQSECNKKLRSYHNQAKVSMQNNNNNSQDSLSIMIEPKEQVEEKRVPREVMKDVDIKLTTQHEKLDLYLTVNKVYLQNLITRRQRPNIAAPLRSFLGANCILYKQFSISIKQMKLFTGDQHPIKGNIHILLNPMMNIQLKIYFSKPIKRPQDYIWMTMHYCMSGMWKSKSVSVNQDGGKFCCKVQLEELSDLIQPNMLVNVAIKRRQVSNCEQLGIVNLGNTCFMNSCLQMLFYIRPLRQIVLQSNSRNTLIRALRKVFIMMMDLAQNKPVDVEQLLSAYDKYNQQPRRQQDVQQFLLDFLNEIQQQCPQAKVLWQGKSTQTTYSKQTEKYYKSTLTQQFAQLDVHLFDREKKYYTRIQDSLKQLMQEQQVDEMIENDDFGKIKVAKYRRFETLPDVLFVNLKRYEWNKEKMRLSKIFSHIQYGENLNLGFIVGTPGSDDQTNPECDYYLFSVLVHKGTSPQNGHYFVFVNTSNNSSSPQWVCFNDSLVTKADVEEVLGFTGKKTKQVLLDKNVGRFVEREIQSDASSYLLVYIRRAVFDSYQGIRTRIPQDYVKQKIKKNAQKQKQSLQDINILAFDNFDNQQQIDLFNPHQQYMVLPLPKNECMIDQLKRLSKSILSIQARYCYKVYVNEKKVKLIYPYETAYNLTHYRRGLQQPTYILLLSQKIPLMAQRYKDKEELGIIKISKNQLMCDLDIPSFGLINSHHLNLLQEAVESKAGRVNYINEKEDFEEGWSWFVEVQLLKSY